MNRRLAWIVAILWLHQSTLAHASGRLVLNAVDKETGKPLAARIHLQNGQGKPFRPAKVKGGIVSGDHIVFADKLTLELPNGRYNFVMEHGPEYRVMNGNFEIQNFADDSKTVELTRFCDLAKEGWFSGDLDVERSDLEIKTLMQAEDLHVVPLVTWTNKKNLWDMRKPPKQLVNQFDDSFFCRVMGGRWTTPGSTLRLFQLDRPLDFPAELASTDATEKKLAAVLGSLPLMSLLEKEHREHGAWIDAGAPFARDLPIWIAAGLVDSVQIANCHLERQSVVANEAGGWPRDLALFAGPHGNGRWSQEIYYRLLNCGLRIPPTAGSGSGANNNPVGYNRVYVHTGVTTEVEHPELFTWDSWWNALRGGRVTITNGPLLRTEVEGQLPGHTFKADVGQTLELAIALTLSTRDKIRYLEVVKNGRTEISVNLDEFKQAGGRFPPLKFDESGWFVIRAVADNTTTYRFATTGPYFVEIGYRPRISRESVKFFLDWTSNREAEIANLSQGGSEFQSTKTTVEQAREFWQQLLDKANAD
ncbi:MAG: hypothetical protein IT427_19935 [Pirellulales bacterium]|nr:hypothetical protein [Pirellulales bacterium]